MAKDLLLFTAQSIFDAASPQAEKIRSLTIGFIWASSAMMLLVALLAIYIPIKYRAKNSISEPKQITGNRRLEILMVGVPMVLVIVFFFWSLTTMSAVLPARGTAIPDLTITGHQWWWEARYSKSKVIAANEIHLPVGRRLLLQLNSTDVIHDWWVPALGGKMDMIPGINNYLWVTINKPGIYEGACSEFCGQQHAWMRIRVVAQLPTDYQHWLDANQADEKQPNDSLVTAGQALFTYASCSSCHSINGTGAAGLQGPNLTHFGSRKTMLAGMLDNTPENLYRWLTDPQKVKPGAHMPRFIFGQDSIRALTAYLAQLK
ncbi:cytochrome c oxidase subunit II [Mucilaginibacter arboris]|uniref:Cytochrome c oxidase subunit 2 n=1 Tax=Mucilaginibacter arboris TaxID=2682090 RepID=A0A7K1SYX3_9SPHI|nr:cytochrome c oxidase subunit II [Mucilaginibacter arboris]MVN22512.1 cytochrome c oxidase subunit II [Mucilaginibacter arboris]